MATIVNNPAPEREVREVHTVDNSGGNGILIALLVIVLLAVLFFAFSRNWFTANNGTNVNVPKQIDVNVNPGSSGGSGGATGQ